MPLRDTTMGVHPTVLIGAFLYVGPPLSFRGAPIDFIASRYSEPGEKARYTKIYKIETGEFVVIWNVSLDQTDTHSDTSGMRERGW